MRKIRKIVSMVLTAAICMTYALSMPTESYAASSADFIKADGKFLKKDSGRGEIVNLRGTNLGGWLTQEDWMSPLGEFAHDRTGWTATASVNSSSAANALDGDSTSSWTTGTAQTSGQWFQVNMGGKFHFNRVYINAADSAGDYPAAYQILVSNDGVAWTDVASGTGSMKNTVVRFSPQVAQYIKIVQTGSSSNYWSISEFNVFLDATVNSSGMSATASSNTSGAGSALDGNTSTLWSTGANQAYGQYFQMNLGKPMSVGRLLIDSGASATQDYPRSYEIYGSYDGSSWTKYASSYGNGRITYSEFWWSQTIQYIKIVQTGSSSNWWSIADVAIYTGGEFDRTGWSVSASQSGSTVNNIKDGDTNTVWNTGENQTAGQWLQVDMGAIITFDQIQLNSGDGYANDYPRGYTVQTSRDGAYWTTVTSGTSSHKALPINFPAVSARYIRLNQTGSASNWWSVSEMNVYLNNDDYDLNLYLKDKYGDSTRNSIVETHQNTWITSADFDNIASMGMNVVRLPIGWLNLLNEDGSWKSDPWSKIDWVIEQCAQRGIYVLLDLHSLPGGNCPWASSGRFGMNPNGFWTNTSYQDWVVKIWEAMADRYKGNPTVCGYDVMNEPLLDYNETGTILEQKNNYYDRLYDAVRAKDQDHTIFIAAFFGFSNICKPAQYGWTNVAYEIHPYDMPGGKDWSAQNSLVNTQLAEVAEKMNDPNWNSPILVGEYSFYHYDDVWSKFMSGMNSLGASWTNWSYKVRGSMTEGIGGYWGLYNSCNAQIPVINNDSPTTISNKYSQFGTSNFQPNTSFINTVKKHAKGQDWLVTTPLEEAGWTASASSAESGSSPSNALDWNSSTRWSSGTAQSNGQWFQVDMGSEQSFDQISIETKSSDVWDYPRGYDVQISNDGTTWTSIKTGIGFGWKVIISFEPQYARYVKIVQTGSAPDWWTISELHIYSEPALNTTGWTTTASSIEVGGSTANAIDGNLSSRWSTGEVQSSGQWFQVDMGDTQIFNRILLDASSSSGDYLRGYTVEVSNDTVNWSTVASGENSKTNLLLEFPIQKARYIKVTQTGEASSWWSIGEFSVYGEKEKSRAGWNATASATDGSSSTAYACDSDNSTRWTTGATQSNGQWFQLDLGSNQWFSSLLMDSSTSTGDYAKKYIIQTSYDANNWNNISQSEGNGQTIFSSFPITEARYIRITLQGSASNWWSIHNIRLFE